MSTFLDAALAELAVEVIGKGKTDFPIGISCERTPQGAYIWKVWLEHGSTAVEASAMEPSQAIEDALSKYRNARSQRN